MCLTNSISDWGANARHYAATYKPKSSTSSSLLACFRKKQATREERERESEKMWRVNLGEGFVILQTIQEAWEWSGISCGECITYSLLTASPSWPSKCTLNWHVTRATFPLHLTILSSSLSLKLPFLSLSLLLPSLTLRCNTFTHIPHVLPFIDFHVLLNF